MEFKLKVRCPKCHHKQLSLVRTTLSAFRQPILTGKYKRCVYCGKSFSVRKQLIEVL